jgi:hypothetical protein
MLFRVPVYLCQRSYHLGVSFPGTRFTIQSIIGDDLGPGLTRLPVAYDLAPNRKPKWQETLNIRGISCSSNFTSSPFVSSTDHIHVPRIVLQTLTSHMEADRPVSRAFEIPGRMQGREEDSSYVNISYSVDSAVVSPPSTNILFRRLSEED